ncbi:MAG: hypothetical protein GX613_03165 [Chloroflexi bacterium]|nr:hypothetical protein [Chloroflexota bacterium]
MARLLLATLPLLLAFAAYGYTLRLPFFVDDGPNLWTTEHLDGIEQWAGTPAFPYYRPAVFTIWKLNDTLYGRFDAPSLHWLNVVSLGVAGVALGQIVRRLLRGQGRGWLGALAGAAFVLFPFSYQAVTLVSAQFHLLLAAGVLLCLALALRWLDGAGGAAVLVACWLSALIGIFSHENGPLLAVLLLGTILVAYPRGARPALRRIVVVAAPVIALSAVYGLLWLVVPRDTSVQADLSPAPEDAFGYLLQGLIYPVSALAKRIFQPESVLPETAIALALGVVALALVALLARGRQAISPGLLGLAWYGAAIAPSALLLAPDYVLGSPRLMMLASAGGALFWAAIGRALWRGRAGCAAVALASVLTLALAITFLWARRDEHLRMGRFTRDLVALGETLPLEQDGVLLVNAPNYIAPAQRTFLLGSEGATFMLDSMSYGQQIWANTGRDHPPVEAITHAATLRYTSGTYQPHGPYLEGEPLDDLLRAAPWIAVTQFSGDKFTPVIVRDPRDLAPAGALARFGEAVTLLDAQASAQLDARALSVRLAWSVQAPAPLKLFVHVWCGDQLVAQSDGYPWGDLYPFAAWQPGEERVERRLIRLPDDVSAACLSVTAGLYHEATLERLPALDPRTSDPLAGETAPVPLDFSG